MESVLLKESSDFEQNDNYVSTEKAFSGKKSCKLSPEMEYGISFQKFIRDIPSYRDLQKISVRYKCYLDSDPDAVFVLAIDDAAGKNKAWLSAPVKPGETGKWSDASAEFVIAPEFLQPENKISMYHWNRNKKTFYIDDLEMEYAGMVAPVMAQDRPGNTNFFFDMESTDGMTGTESIKATQAHSGSKACDLSDGREFGPIISKKIREISSAAPSKISMSIWIYPLSDAPNAVLTASVINSRNETVFWDGETTENRPFPKNKWTKLNTSYFLPVDKISPDDILNVNLWNKGKTAIIIDDLEIVYGEPAERRGKASTIDAKSIYDKRFVDEQNQPPYPTLWLQKQETGNGNGIEEFSPGDIILPGNFVADRNDLDEILCIGKNKQALFAYDPAAKQFKKLWENSSASDPLWNSSTYYLDANDDLVVKKANSDGYSILHFDGKSWTEKTQPGSPRMKVTELYKDEEAFFTGNFTSDKQQVLKRNYSWRFDLKLTENEVILGNVDFKGYPADHNPKYYEFVKLVSGRFTSSGRNSVLVIMANCADNDFKGSKCNNLENLPYLPNCTQLYHFSE